MEWELLRGVALALALGLLVGLQREWAEKGIAGIRTFPLITLFGALCGILTGSGGGLWLIASGILAVAATFWIGNRMRMHADGAADPGLTTEFAGFVMFLVGVVLVRSELSLGVVTGGVVAVLLHWKGTLHRFVERLGKEDIRAVVRLVILGLIVLPLLPNRTFGPYDVINPFSVWLMILLIVGISLVSYVVQRLLGEKVGTLLAGFLGGLISSTATTVSYSRQAQKGGVGLDAALVVVIIASTMVFGRVLAEVAIVAPGLVVPLAAPLGAMAGGMILLSVVAALRVRSSLDTPAPEAPPSDLASAIVFGILYAAVLFGVAWTQEHVGDQGMFVVAGLSGLTDMDAITLSTAQLAKADRVDTETAWRLILVGALANLVFKTLIVAAMADRRLLGRVAGMLGLAFAWGVALLLFWPD